MSRSYVYPTGPLDMCLESLNTESGWGLQASACTALEYIRSDKAHGAYPEAFVEAINEAGASGRAMDQGNDARLRSSLRGKGTGHVFNKRFGNKYGFSAESRWPTPAEVMAFLGEKAPVMSGSAPIASVAFPASPTAPPAAATQLAAPMAPAPAPFVITRQQREKYYAALDAETQTMVAHVNFYRAKRGEARISAEQLTAEQKERCQTAALQAAGLMQSPDDRYRAEQATTAPLSREAQFESAERAHAERTQRDSVADQDAITAARVFRQAKFGAPAPKSTGQAARSNPTISEPQGQGGDDIDPNEPAAFRNRAGVDHDAIAAARAYKAQKESSGRP